MIEFSIKEIILIFVASICISFGTTIPFGLLLFTYIIVKKFKMYREDKIKSFNTYFIN
jgi:hypothetical protein